MLENDCYNNKMLVQPPQQSILPYYLGCVIPLLLLGQIEPFVFNNLMMKYTPEIRCMHVRLMLSE